MKTPILLLGAILSACAHQQPTVQGSMTEYNNCLISNVARIDDLYSDAASVAKALAATCYVEYQASLDAYIKNESPAVKRKFMNRMEKRNQDYAIMVVFKYRQNLKTPTKYLRY